MSEAREVRISLDALTIGDLVILDQAARGDLPAAALVELLDRVVIGGARQLPLAAMTDIVNALNREIAALQQRGN